MSRYYITTPIYYANALPHIGHAYTTVAADAVARYQRQQGRSVFLLTGTDEHGINIERIAARDGQSAQQHVDGIATAFRSLWSDLDIRYDRFIRTTEAAHHRAAVAVWQRLQASGDLYRATYSGAYCSRCEAYYQPDELVDPNGACPVHLLSCDAVSEENWFFRLSRYQADLERLVGETDFVRPESRRNEVLATLRQGVRDFSVSRRQVRWGVPVPGSPDEVIYVWVDALSNYLTGIGFPDNPSAFERWWPADLHLVGKEIIRFHCIYWPALLLSAGLPLPRAVFAHGWLTKDGEKISKTTGNTVEPTELVREFGSDAVRYYLLRSVVFGQDGDYTRRGFVERYQADLANGFGNLVQRVTSLASRYGVCSEAASGGQLAAAAQAAYAGQARAFDDLALHTAVAVAGDFVREVNRYLQATAPWDLARSGRRDEVGRVVSEAVAATRVAAELYAPIIPRAAAEALRRLASTPPVVGEPLFPRLNRDAIGPRDANGDKLFTHSLPVTV